ncbi:hypothetical protein ACJX0J_018266, partial [Zea mays]
MNVDVYVLIYLDESTICFEPYLSDLKLVIILLDCTSAEIGTAAALTPCACKNPGWICMNYILHDEVIILLDCTSAEIGTAAALTPCACKNPGWIWMNYILHD